MATEYDSRFPLGAFDKSPPRFRPESAPHRIPRCKSTPVRLGRDPSNLTVAQRMSWSMIASQSQFIIRGPEMHAPRDIWAITKDSFIGWLFATLFLTGLMALGYALLSQV